VHHSKLECPTSGLGHQLPLGADAECFRNAPNSGPYLKLIDWPKGATTDSCTAASDVPVMGIATSPESRRLRSQPSHVA
jgi:hypothetical protein